MRRDGCTCPIEVVDVDHDGTPVRGCIDPACDCDVCGHEPLAGCGEDVCAEECIGVCGAWS